MDAKILQALREQHGEVVVVEFEREDGSALDVVLRKPRVSYSDPKADEFFSFWTKRTALQQAAQDVVVRQRPFPAVGSGDGGVEFRASILRCGRGHTGA